MRRITEIIVHCSATREGKYFTAEDIDRWHKAQGFACIGYHFVVRTDGRIEMGRSIERVGAHCKGHNAHSIGICYVGGVDSYGKPKDTRTLAQKDALVNLLMRLKRRFPKAVIRGHRDFAAKACPSFDATKEYAGISNA